MKIKLDENIPHAAVAVLQQFGHEVDSVADEGLRGATDDDVFVAAGRSGRMLITQDLDFSDMRRFRPGTHSGLLLLRLKEPGRRALLQRMVWLFQNEPVAAWAGYVVIVTDNKIRLRHP